MQFSGGAFGVNTKPVDSCNPGESADKPADGLEVEPAFV